MPLARIITDHVDESVELAIQLRARGFEVETVSPNHIPDTPADLVVELDTCHTNDILARVMEISAESDSFVLVAPGALDETSSQRVLPATEAEWLFSRKARRQKEEANRLAQASAAVETQIEQSKTDEIKTDQIKTAKSNIEEVTIDASKIEAMAQPTNGARGAADPPSPVELPAESRDTAITNFAAPILEAEQPALPLELPSALSEVAVVESAALVGEAVEPITITEARAAAPEPVIQKSLTARSIEHESIEQKSFEQQPIGQKSLEPAAEPAAEPDEPLFAELPSALPELAVAKSADAVAEPDAPITITEAPAALPEVAFATLSETAAEADEPLFALPAPAALPESDVAKFSEPALEPEPAAEPAHIEVPAYPLPEMIRVQPPQTAPGRAAARGPLVSRPHPTDAAFWRIAIIAAALAVAVVIAGSAWQQRRPAPGTLPAPASQRFPFQKPGTQPAPAAATQAPAQKPAPAPPQNSSPAQAASPAPPPLAPTPAQTPAPHATQPAVTAKKGSSKKTRASVHHTAPTHSTDSGRIAEDTVVYYGPRPPKTAGSSTTKQ